MSSERAGAHTVGICGTQMRNTPRRNVICDLPAGHAGWHSAPDYEAMQPEVLQVVPRIDWAERAGVHTSGALNREKARDVLARKCPAINDTHGNDVLDRLEACVVQDPRLDRIEALLNDETLGDHLYPEDIRAILRGDQ